MSIPGKKGLRYITIDNIRYYWTFQTGGLDHTMRITIGRVDQRNQILCIEIYHNDPWLYFNEKDLPENEVNIVTPGFIRRAIEFGCAQSWGISEKTRLRLLYGSQNFTLLQQSSNT